MIQVPNNVVTDLVRHIPMILELLPDNTSQYKYFPWFEYSRDAAGFVYAYTADTAALAFAFLGSRLCFKTRERAMQFVRRTGTDN